MEENQIYYRYFKNDKHQKNQIVCIGYEVNKVVNFIEQNTGNFVVRYAIAFCGGKDFFSRKKAREILHQRIDSNCTSSFEIDPGDFPFNCVPDLMKVHYNSLSKKGTNRFGVKQYPAWAKYIK